MYPNENYDPAWQQWQDIDNPETEQYRRYGRPFRRRRFRRPIIIPIFLPPYYPHYYYPPYPYYGAPYYPYY